MLLIEPYFTGSHADWARGLKAHSRHHIDILSLKGQYWKWRMHGGAVTLAREFMKSDFQPDLILVTDMLDLTTFLSLTRARTADVPAAVYFHESQICYPWSSEDRDILNKRDRHYGFINYTSALAADACFFNSKYHMDTFLEKLVPFLKHFPDHRELGNIDTIRQKSRVLHLGLDLKRFDQYKTERSGPPLILWNHRWEYDKNPDDFFKVIFKLADEGHEFNLALLGENFSQKPEIFETARDRLGNRIVQYGYADSFEAYARWLWRADILPVTSNHDFFGASVVEAVYCGCVPVLPRRLSYPEVLSPGLSDRFFYSDLEEMHWTIKSFFESPDRFASSVNQKVIHYDWSNKIVEYDSLLEAHCR